MERNALEQEAVRLVTEAEANRINGSDDPIFDAPLLGVAAADDPLFRRMKERELVGERFILPAEWLPGAKTVLSVFFPFSEAVRKSNRMSGRDISFEWLYGRIEGQQLILKTMNAFSRILTDAGLPNVVPMLDPRFWDGVKQGLYTSNWSERHVAFIAGLGTFGLSRGLITRRGMAGRFSSLVTAVPFPPDEREYEDPYEYCIRCGACVKNCPAGAISLEEGKDHTLCSKFLDFTGETYSPRYGCGKCQVGVPCEYKVPELRNPSKR